MFVVCLRTGTCVDFCTRRGLSLPWDRTQENPSSSFGEFYVFFLHIQFYVMYHFSFLINCCCCFSKGVTQAMVGHVVCRQLPARSLAHAVVALQLHVIVQDPAVFVHGYAVDDWVAGCPQRRLPCCSDTGASILLVTVLCPWSPNSVGAPRRLRC